MASNLKEKFDSLMDKSFPPTANNKSQRSRPAPGSARDNNDDTSQESAADTADEDQRINYAEVCTYINIGYISLLLLVSALNLHRLTDKKSHHQYKHIHVV